VEPTVLLIFLYASFTAIATGFGALPFLFVKQFSKKYLGLANAIAAGLMLAASFGLIYQGTEHDASRTVIGVLAGLVFIVFSHRLLDRYKNIRIGSLDGLDAKKALLLVGIMTVHSFAEGVGVGVSFGDGAAFGLLITIAIAVHNIPEGLAISLVLVPKGVSLLRAAWWSIFSSLPQPLMAVPAFLFVQTFKPFLPVGLGFAAGAMIWLAVSEILPEALEEAPHGAVATALTLSVAAMVGLQVLLAG